MFTLRWLGFAALVTVLATFLAYEAETFIRVIPDTYRDSTFVFIPPNGNVKSIATQLKKSGVLKEAWKFRALSRLMKLERKLKPGEYRFFQPSSAWEVLKTLSTGKTILHRVTFPEGITMKEVSEILAAENIVRLEEFTALLARKDLLDRFKIPANSFEGFLFPETYFFSKTDEPLTILQAMIDHFRAMTPPSELARAKELNLSLLQWVTLASIIEKETGAATEQPMVSSVFHNRLKKKMRLQSDPTVIYGISNFDGNIRKKDLLFPTPYNTYTHAGLPPGPIANPGATALKAALYPAVTNFLYFVAKRDGTHAFSATYEEHQRNVNTYQLRIRGTHD